MNLEELVQAASEFGGTDREYLESHFDRFTHTVERCLAHATPEPGAVLDLGGHWLHQSIMFAHAGFTVTAVDIPQTFKLESVRLLAQRWQIDLVCCDNLAHPSALRAIEDNSMDVVLLTEILEHLAFNPVALWKELHRILRPGGRILISTPNYYALRTLVPKVFRFLSLKGGGVSVAEVLGQPTYAHHWKEYSGREICLYFESLSSDFRISFLEHLRYSRIKHRLGWLLKVVEFAVPMLRPCLHIEVDLVTKDKGIMVEDAWCQPKSKERWQFQQLGQSSTLRRPIDN